MASYLYLFGQKIGTKNILYARSSFYSTKKMLTATNHHLDVEKNDSNKKIIPTEHLEQYIKSAIDPTQVLSALPSTPAEYKKLSGETVVYALKTIATLQKANSKSMKQNFILSHPNFELLCRRLKICSPIFTGNELIDSFRLLCLLGVPKNSELSLHLLQLIRHEINYLDVNQIIFLCFILDRNESCSEIENSVRTALPMVLDQQISEQITSEQSVEELVKILNFMSAHQSSYIKDTNVKRICRILAGKKIEIDITNAINIIHSLCIMNRFELGNTIRLLNICTRAISNNLYEVNIIDLMPTVQRLVSTVVNQNLSFQYHIHGILKRSGERIAQQNLGLKIAVDLQTACKRISYRNRNLLEYIGDQMASNPSYCRTMDHQELFTIVHAFAYNGCPPESVDNKIWKNQIVPNIMKNENLANVPPLSRLWLKFVFQLMILDHYEQDLINRVLSREYLDKYFSNNCNQDRSVLLDFYQTLAIYQSAMTRPEIDLSSVQKSVLEGILSEYTARLGICKIQQALIQQIGLDFVVTNVRTKNYHFLPTLLKMNTKTECLEHFPTNLQRDDKGFISLDDIPCAEDEKIICVDIIKKYHLFSNFSKMHIRYLRNHHKLGIFSVRNQQLMDLGVTVCNINQGHYERLNEMDRIDYFRESIFGLSLISA